MKKFIYFLDNHINLITILFLFWAFFWGLNGADKFFNGTSTPNLDKAAATHALVDENGKVVYTVQPSQKIGWYGVNRDAKFANYFRTLRLPQVIATSSLYFFAVLEITLAILFFWLFLKQFSKNDSEGEDSKNVTLFSDRTIHRLVFKGSIWIFIAFLTGDILFGDRAEVWEHGTFLLMTLVTYDLWYRTDQFFLDMKKQNRSRDDRGGGSIQSSSYDLRTD